MKKILTLFFLIFFVTKLHAYTYSNNIGAAFDKDEVKVYVASNGSCTNAGTTIYELEDLVTTAINSYWNKITTSRLRLKNGGILSVTDPLYNTGKLCNPDLESNCSSGYLPKVTDIVIACNTNTVDNFTSTGIYAITLNNNISGRSIVGSAIVINDAAGSSFANLTSEQIVVVLAHEIGHAIGLGHTANPANLMYYTLTPKRVSLGQSDIDGASSLYPQKFDGCGLIGSIAQVGSDNSNDSGDPPFYFFIINMMVGFFFAYFLFVFIIMQKKLISKFSKPIF